MNAPTQTPTIATADSMQLRPGHPNQNADGSWFCALKNGQNEVIGFVDAESSSDVLKLASFVCAACNAHDALVSALQFVSKYAVMQMQKGKPLPGQLVGAVNKALTAANASLL